MDKKQVLIVEDEEWVRRGLVKRVEKMSDFAQVAGAAPDIESALDLAASLKHIDILFTDIMLTDGSGLDLIPKIQSLHPNVGVYIISGYSEFSFAQTAIGLGVSGYLLKPIKDDELRQALCANREPDNRSSGLKSLPADTEQLLAQAIHAEREDSALRILRQVMNDLSALHHAKANASSIAALLSDATERTLVIMGIESTAFDLLRNQIVLMMNTIDPEAWQYDVANAIAAYIKGQIFGSQQRKQRVIRQIQSYIAAHLNGDLSLDALSARFALSAGYLSRLFKEISGEGLNEYITRCRIERACEWLRLTTLTASAISEQLGYADSSYFSRVFQRETGMTPGDYRKQQVPR